jgi:THO complex subunit 4
MSDPFKKRGRRPYRNRRGNDRRKDMDSPWMHDLYGDNPAYSTAHERQISVSDANFCVKIENLHWNVTQEDLQELFSAVGVVSQIKIHFDRSGRSEGKATIFYVNEQDAKAAVEEYNGRQLDGLELSVTIDSERNILSRLGNRSLDARLGSKDGILNRLGSKDGILNRLGEKSDTKRVQRKKVSMRREDDVVMEDTREQVSYADAV